MPNKKARTKTLPEVDFDLPPTASSALPTVSSLSSNPSRSNKKRKRKAAASKDDTPKAFTRLLARADPNRPKVSSLDDGTPRNKKKQKQGSDASKPAKDGKPVHASSQDVPATRLQIGPNESLKDFARRVDAAMPVKFPRGQGSTKPLKKTLAERQIAHELAERERLDAERSESEDEEEDVWAQAGFPVKKKGRKGKKGAGSDDEDPWKVLEEKRGKAKFGEVAEAPPQLKKPKAVFKVYDGAGVKVEGVPKSAGSLMRREELAGERADIVAAYRKLMEEKRGGAGLGFGI